MTFPELTHRRAVTFCYALAIAVGLYLLILPVLHVINIKLRVDHGILAARTTGGKTLVADEPGERVSIERLKAGGQEFDEYYDYRGAGLGLVIPWGLLWRLNHTTFWLVLAALVSVLFMYRSLNRIPSRKRQHFRLRPNGLIVLLSLLWTGTIVFVYVLQQRENPTLEIGGTIFCTSPHWDIRAVQFFEGFLKIAFFLTLNAVLLPYQCALIAYFLREHKKQQRQPEEVLKAAGQFLHACHVVVLIWIGYFVLLKALTRIEFHPEKGIEINPTYPLVFNMFLLFYYGVPAAAIVFFVMSKWPSNVYISARTWTVFGLNIPVWLELSYSKRAERATSGTRLLNGQESLGGDN